MRAVLKYTDNPKVTPYVNQPGDLQRNAIGGFEFRCDSGAVINTSPVKSVLNPPEDIRTKTSYIKTEISEYTFEILGRERLADGVYKPYGKDARCDLTR